MLETPGESLPLGGKARNVSLRIIANKYDNMRPSQKTGMETPIFATAMVPPSTAVL
jgi:hypothetical protein